MQTATPAAGRVRLQLREARDLYRLVTTGGSDALHFLQGQLTQDVTRLARTDSLPAALCDAKGRVIATLRLITLADGYGLVTPASLAEPLLERLAMYRLRADVSLDLAAADWTAIAIDSDADRELLRQCGLLPDRTLNGCRSGAGLHTVAAGDALVEVFGTRSALAAAGLEFSAPRSDSAWQAARIRAGSADVTLENSGKYTPHMLNLDLTGAVSFDKGCYTGQEIVARTEHLGKVRRRLARYVTDRPVAAIGDKLTSGGQPVAEVVNAAGRELLALAPVAQHGNTLEIRGASAVPAALPYAIPAQPD